MIREIKICWCGAIAEGNTDQCASHNEADRKAEKQAMKMQVVKPANKVSEKRAVQNKEYFKLRKEYLEAYPCCEVEDCNLKSVDVHHQKGRDGDKLLDVNFFMAVCRKHHTEIEANPNWAKSKGYSENRLSNQQPL